MWRVYYLTPTGQMLYRSFESLHQLVNTMDQIGIIEIKKEAGNGAPGVMEPIR